MRTPIHISVFFLIASFFIFSCSVFKNSRDKHASDSTVLKTDTTSGFYLYEVDVPQKCYTRFDQVEQGNNLIFFDSLGLARNITDVYKKGVFIFDYQPIINRFITDNKGGISQNKMSIETFNMAIRKLLLTDGEAGQQKVYFDNSRTLKYKRIFARFSFVSLGKLRQLIPDMRNYQCCYSNRSESIETYFITDIIDFRIF